MKFNLENLPQCEKCEVFTSDETRTSTARAIFCEGLRAVGSCPKDEWSEGCKKELREQIERLTEIEHHSKGSWRKATMWLQSYLKEILGDE